MQDLINITGTSRDERRAQIMALQDFFVSVAEEHGTVETPVRHFFAPGLYAREISIPAGTALVGKIHRHAHLLTVSHGTIQIVDEDGDRILQAPCTLLSTPGIKRVGRALTDVVFTTYHATTETDIEKLDALITAPDYAALEIQP